MSKYISSKNPVDIEKIDEKFKEKYKQSEELAKEKTDKLIEEIKYYKSTSSDELIKKIDEEFDELYKNVENAPVSLSSIYFISTVKEAIEYELEFKMLGTPDEIKKETDRIFNSLDDQEKITLFKRRKKHKLDMAKSKRIHEVITTDMLYDLLTDEQMQQFVELYYLQVLKKALVGDKVDAVIEVSKELDKKSNLAPVGQKRVSPDLFEAEYYPMQTVYEEVEKVTKVEEPIEKELKAIERIKEGAKEIVKKVIIPSGIGLGVTGFIAGYAKLMSDLKIPDASQQLGYNAQKFAEQFTGAPADPIQFQDINVLREVLKKAPFIIGIVLACFGVKKGAEFIRDKRAIDEAKKFGIYDMIIDSINSKEEYKEYVEKLKLINGISGDIKGRAIV